MFEIDLRKWGVRNRYGKMTYSIVGKIYKSYKLRASISPAASQYPVLLTNVIIGVTL